VEESLRDGLLAAGESLAEVLRLGLSERGRPSDFSVFLNGNKVVVASRSADLRDDEVGRVGSPPKGIMEGVARDAIPHILQTFVERVGSTRL
jgi:hypothetical protein